MEEFLTTYDNFGNYNPTETISNNQDVLDLNTSSPILSGLTGFLPNNVSATINGYVVQGDQQSANFLTEVSGWQIKANGDAEFNDAIFRGEVDIGDPNGAEVVIAGNDIFLYDASVGGTNPVTGDTASIHFLRREDSTRGFILQERASINSNDDTVLEIFSIAPAPTNDYNYIFIGLEGDDLVGTSANVNNMTFAVNVKSGESPSVNNGIFEIITCIDNILPGFGNFLVGDSRDFSLSSGSTAVIQGVAGGAGGIGYESSIGWYQLSTSAVAMGLNVLPDTDNAYDIGSASFQIKDLYIAGTIHGTGLGTVSSVTSANALISVTNTTTTPVLTSNPIFYQQLPLQNATHSFSSTLSNSTSELDGSVIYGVGIIGNSATLFYLVRYARDSLTGQYIVTNTVNPASTNVSGTNICLAIDATFLYVFADFGGSGKIIRFLKSNLSNETLMTISGTVWAGGGTAFSDGTNIYVYETFSNPNSEYRKYTISGTTATNAGLISYQTFSSAISAVSNGVFVWMSSSFSGGLIFKFLLSGGGAVNTQFFFPFSSIQSYQNQSVMSFVIVRVGILGQMFCHSVTGIIGSSGAGVTGQVYELYPFTAP